MIKNDIVDNKKRYIEICNTHKIPLFSKYYWMDSVCGEENWNVIIIEEDGHLMGLLVYFLNKLDNGKYEIRKAPLSQNNGIIYFYPQNIKYDKKLSFENKVCNKIIDELEKLDIIKYCQYFHHKFTNWMPFYWRGYNQTTRYTYIIEDTSNMELVYNNFNGNIRNYIKKAQKIVNIKKHMPAKDFYEINRKTYIRQEMEIPYDFNLFNRLYDKLKLEDCLEIIYAEDEDKNIHSAALFVYDETTVYYLMSGSDYTFRDSQSLTLLVYEGIKLANKLGKSFDFEGSMKLDIEKFFRQFGAKQKMYFDISKDYI